MTMAEHDEPDASESRTICDLREVVSGARDDCDGNDCVYWRALEHVDVGTADRSGCAISSFEMLADKNPEVAVWLLSVKRRMDELEGEPS
jgi:hypothetical protein